MKEKLNLWLAIGFLAGAALLFGLAISTQNQWNTFDEKYESTLGRVVEMRVSNGRYYPVVAFMTLDSQRIHYRALEAMGKKYDYEVGQTLTVHYDFINPDDAHLERSEPFWVVFLYGTSGVFALLGVYLFWLFQQAKQQRSLLLQRGRRVKARIVSVSQDPQENMRYVITCEWVNAQGKSLIFRSEGLTKDPTHTLPQNGSIEVYFMPENPEIYWVDFKPET